MFNALAESGLVPIRHGRITTVAGEPEGDTRASGRLRLTRPQYGHDCKPSERKPHVCKPMTKSTIRIIHSIAPPWFRARGRAFAAPYPHRAVVLATHHEDYFRARAMMSAVKDLFTLSSQPTIRRLPGGSVIPSAGADGRG
jgi:hypothetical protein